MSFEADRMRNLILTDDVIKTERDVILEERRSRIDNNPQAVLDEEVDATLWQNQPYRIPVIGWMQEMEQLNRIDATAFYPPQGRNRLYAMIEQRPDWVLSRASVPGACRSRVFADRASGNVMRDEARHCPHAQRRQGVSRRNGWCRPITPQNRARRKRSTCWPKSSAAATAAGSTRRWSSSKALLPAPARSFRAPCSTTPISPSMGAARRRQACRRRGRGRCRGGAHRQRRRHIR